MNASLSFRALALAGFGAFVFQARAALPPSERAVVLSESLARVSPEAVQNDPKLQAALEQVLPATRGTPQFVTLIQKFNLKGHDAELLDIAQAKPSDDVSVTAMRTVVANNAAGLVKSAFRGPHAMATAEALGNVTHKRAVAWLAGVLNDAASSDELRKQAVRALAHTHDGANELFARVKAGTLAGPLGTVAGDALRGAPWAEVREEASRLFAGSTPANTAVLPPVEVLLAKRGDPANGAKVFRRETVNCIGCHQVNSEGKDFGPALSEIGTKLGKDVLYQSIIDPSAGISFGFESWAVELKNGDELYGLIVNETENEITIKDARAIPTPVKKSAIALRTQSKLSIMPSGLPQLMTEQELVDLVEYLATLKKP